jgi:hypothetical protein
MTRGAMLTLAGMAAVVVAQATLTGRARPPRIT